MKHNKGIANMDNECANLEVMDSSQIEVGVSNANNFKSLLIPLMEKVDKSRESVDNKYAKLVDAITTQRREVSQELHELEETITTHDLS